MNHKPGECLYVSDLDGTLLEPGSSFPQSSVERLNRMIDRGLNFSIATARTYDSAHPLLKEVNLRLPVILFNGVFLTEFHTGHNLIETDFIAQNIVHDIMEFLRPHKMDPFIYLYGEESRVMHGRAANEGAKRYFNSLESDGRLCQVEHYHFEDGERIAGFLIIDQPQRLDPVYAHLSETFPDDLNLYYAQDIADPDFYWLQAFHAEANKGRMVSRLAEREGISLDRVVVFGDYLNDLEMFKIAGRSLAMGNALPEVQQVADQVIGSNEEQGVLGYLESLGL